MVATLWVASAEIRAQSLISNSDFFNPDYEARRPGAAGFISLDVNTALYTPGDQSQGNVTWNHSAGGLVQAGVDLNPIVNGTIDVQLAAYTNTLGNALTFGRDLDVTTTGILGPFGGLVTSLTDDVVGASAINSWASTATVTGLNLVQGQAYSVTFNVNAGAGINLAALSAANFGLTSGATTIQDINSVETLNILNALQVGGGLASINFEFVAQSAFTELTFAFDAATLADVNALGTISGNQTVMQFTNMSLAPVPEASSLFLLAAGMLFQLRRHRRCA